MKTTDLIRTRSTRRPLAASILALLAVATVPTFAADQYFAGDGSALSASKWAATNAGPFSSAFTTGNVANFAIVNGTGTGGSITVAGIVATENFTLTGPTGTISNQSNGVITISVAAGKVLDLSTQNLSGSATGGYIFNGNSTGVLATAGNTYGGGFTLQSGVVIVRGVNALGSATGNILTLNGGTVASNATRDLSAKYSGGIVIGGNVQFGELAANVALASDSANLTFTNNMSLGNANRTLTLGNGGNVGFGGVISNTAGNSLTFAATAGGTGRFDVTNTANTFTGDLKFTGGEVRFTGAGSLGNVNNNIIIDGGRLATLSGATYEIATTHAITIGDTAGTAISTPGAGTLTYNGAIADISGKTGAWAKQGGGTLALGGASTYTGATAINNGTVQLTTGNNRLPTGTVVSLGQAASANVGTLDLNGFNQEVAGLQSTTGTNASVNRNTVTSATAATLTINNSADYVFSAGTAANSGNLTGALSVVKKGAGKQTFGGANTYTGTTGIEEGTLIVSGALAGSTYTVAPTTAVVATLASGTGNTFAPTQSTGNAVTIGGGALGSTARLAPGDVGAVGTINFTLAGTAQLAFGARSELNFDITDATTYDKVAFNAAPGAGEWLTGGGTAKLQLAGTIDYNATYVVFSNAIANATPGGFTFNSIAGYDFANWTPIFGQSGNDYTLSFVAVPEPSALLSLVFGASVLGCFRRFRRMAHSRAA